MRIHYLTALWAMASWAPVAAQGSEFRVGGLTMNSQRNTIAAGLEQGEATLSGGDLLLRTSNFGLHARLLRGTFSATADPAIAGDLMIGELGVLLGGRVIMAEFGYGRRARSESFSETDIEYARVGLAATIRLGSSGFYAGLGATGYGFVADRGGNSEFDFLGGNAETQLLYVLPRGIPLFVSLGYRYERFIFVDEGDRDEELSSVLLGGGVRFGKR